MQPRPGAGNALRGWLIGEHLSSLSDVPGLLADAACYQAIETPTEYRLYPAKPELTMIYRFQPGSDPHAVVEGAEFVSWWRASIRTRFPWVAEHRWVICRQNLGPQTQVSDQLILLTEVDVATGHEDEWGPWYEEHHVRAARAVPGLFGSDLRRFTSEDHSGPTIHISSHPRFLQVLPIAEEADLAALTSTPQYLDQLVDTQVRWGGALEWISGTICHRMGADPPA